MFCSSGLSPWPSAGVTASVSNGLVTNESRPRKKIPMPISTAMTTGISSRLRLRLMRTQIAVKPVKIQPTAAGSPPGSPTGR